MGGSEPVESQPIKRTRDTRPGVWALLGGLSFVVFAAHMLVSGRYGYFVDELYTWRAAIIWRGVIWISLR